MTARAGGSVLGHFQTMHTPCHAGSYAKIGSTRILQADPSVLHFGGFEVGKVYTLKLRIRNVKASGTRVHIVPPSTPFFKVRAAPRRTAPQE